MTASATKHLTRTAFQSSRLAEFASVKEPTTQTGDGPEQWPLAIVKELTDNGIDAPEIAGVAPVIKIAVADNTITVNDIGADGFPTDSRHPFNQIWDAS
jgi:DNA topoisomerase VI subunit B